MKHLIIAAALALAVIPSAYGVGLGLCNTGVNGPCTGFNGVGSGGLATQGGPESNWVLGGGTAVVPTDSAIPSSWISNASSPMSQWISPALDTFAGGGINYSYSIAFNIPLTADLSSATIFGRYASDNETVNVLLNGTSVAGFPLNSTPSGFQNWTSFTINSANGLFVPTANTLTFVVTNGGTRNPQGLRVEFLEASVNDVPEPSTFLMGGIGLIALGVARRRKSQLSARQD